MLIYLQRREEVRNLPDLLETQLLEEKDYWRDVLKRVVAVINTLAERGLSFSGTNEIFGALDNGNYLGLLELVALFDPFLRDHIVRYRYGGRVVTSYLSKTICEELINIMGQKVRTFILNEVSSAKYFSISVDSTPDLSHVDQLSVILRYVFQKDGKPVERFLSFLPLDSHTGEKLANQLVTTRQTCLGNIKALLRNASYVNLSTNSPTTSTFLTTAPDSLSNKKKYENSKCKSKHRSLSHPPWSIYGTNINHGYHFQQSRHFTTDDVEEYQDHVETYFYDEDIVANRARAEYQLERIDELRRTRIAQRHSRLQPKQQTPYLENDVTDYTESSEVPPITMKEPPPKFPFRKGQHENDPITYINEEVLIDSAKPYNLRDSKHNRRENFADVFSHFCKKYELEDKTIVHHLQPNNLRPFGAGTNLTFPSALRRRSTTHQVTEPQEAQDAQVSSIKGISSNTNQEREYSTSAVLSRGLKVQPEDHNGFPNTSRNLLPVPETEMLKYKVQFKPIEQKEVNILDNREQSIEVDDQKQSTKNVTNSTSSDLDKVDDSSSCQKPIRSYISNPFKYTKADANNRNKISHTTSYKRQRSLGRIHLQVPCLRYKSYTEIPESQEDNSSRPKNISPIVGFPIGAKAACNKSGFTMMMPKKDSNQKGNPKPSSNLNISKLTNSGNYEQKSRSFTSCSKFHNLVGSQQQEEHDDIVQKDHNMPNILLHAQKLFPNLALSANCYSTNTGTFCPDGRVSDKALDNLAKDAFPHIEHLKPCYAQTLTHLPRNTIPKETSKICWKYPICTPRVDASSAMKAKIKIKVFPLHHPSKGLVKPSQKISTNPEPFPQKTEVVPKLNRKSAPKLNSESRQSPQPITTSECKPLEQLNFKMNTPAQQCPKLYTDSIGISESKQEKQLSLRKLKFPYFPHAGTSKIQHFALSRLNKLKVKDAKSCRVKPVYAQNVKADNNFGYKIKQKRLSISLHTTEGNRVGVPTVRISRREYTIYRRHYSNKKDCECIEPPIPETAPELKRLPKYEKEDVDWKELKRCKKRSCKKVERADDCLKTKRRRLPKLKPGKCSCIDPYKNMQDCDELCRLPKFKKKDINWKKLKSCRLRDCSKRADEDLKEKDRSLPKLKVSQVCPCIDPLADMKDCDELCRLPKFKKPDKKWKKLCPPFDCKKVERADDCMDDIKRKLPKLKPGNCPCIDPYKNMEDCDELCRLPKFKKKDKNWIKIKACGPRECSKRADEDMKAKKRRLPVLKAKRDCPCIDPFKDLEDCDDLCRLPKFDKPDKNWKKLCKKFECKDMERADDCLESQRRRLPKLKPGKCRCIDPYKNMQDCDELCRLPKFKKKDINWKKLKACRLRDCSKRADEDLKEKDRSLPKLKVSQDCPCIDPLEDMKDCDELCRLPKFKKPDKNWKKLCPPFDCKMVERADDCMDDIKRKLPKLKPGSCPCIDPYKNMEDCDELCRLPKFKKKDKNWKKIKACGPRECSKRADEDMKAKKRRLPVLKAKRDCPCIDPFKDLEDCDELCRLPKFEKPDKNWKKLCKKFECKDMERADDCLESQRRRLPKLKPGKCRCIDPYKNMQDCDELCRLPKFKKKDINWKKLKACRLRDCSKRADEDLKEKDRSLPKLKVSQDCPCIDPLEDMKDCDELCRLPKFKKPDKNWKKLCPPFDCKMVERADDCMDDIKRKLPKLKPGSCPCIDPYKNMEDCDELCRLPKFKKKDKNWKKIKACGPRECSKRADEDMKAKKRRLPVLKAKRDCPCIDPFKDLQDCDELCRLPKFEKPDKNWKKLCKKFECKDMERADDCLESQRRRLPKLKPGKCRCIDPYKNMQDCDELCRLPKFKKKDINWKKLKACRLRDCSKRADEDLKDKDRSLPKLKVSQDCPCIDPLADMKDCDELCRLPKFKKPDKNWKKLCPPFDCKKVERADDCMDNIKRKLPKLKPGNCPCIDPYKNMEDCDELCRLPKFRKRDINWKKVQECKKPICIRADDDLIERKRKLPSLSVGYIKRRKRSRKRGFSLRKSHYHTYCIHTIQTSRYSTGNKKCKKLKSAQKPKCPKLTMPGCPPRGDPDCDRPYQFKTCSKQKTPYPSFSECGEIGIPPTCDCKVPDLRILQPKYPIFDEGVILKAPPPEQGPIDTSLAKECVMKKLNIKDEGKTETCEDFGQTALEYPAKEILQEAIDEAERQACEEGTTLAEMRRKAMEAACCKDKSAPGKKGVCPKPDTDTCGGAEEPRLKSTREVKKRKSMLCGAKDDKEEKCAPSKPKRKKVCVSKKKKKSKGKTCGKRKKTQSKGKPCGKRKKVKKSKSSKRCKSRKGSKSKVKKPSSSITIKELCKAKKSKAPKRRKSSKSRSCSKGSSKSAKRKSSRTRSSSRGVPAECSDDKPKSFIQRILALFGVKPACPKPGKMNAKRLKSDSKQSASAAVCQPKPCKAVRINVSKIKKSKFPSKKGASKVKKRRKPKRGKKQKSLKKLKGKRSKKSKSAKKCKSRSSSKSSCQRTPKKSKSKSSCKSTKSTKASKCGKKKSQSSCKSSKSRKSSKCAQKRSKSRSSCKSSKSRKSRKSSKCAQKRSKSSCKSSKSRKSSKSSKCAKKRSQSKSSCKSSKSSKDSKCGKKRSKSQSSCASSKSKKSTKSSKCGKRSTSRKSARCKSRSKSNKRSKSSSSCSSKNKRKSSKSSSRSKSACSKKSKGKRSKSNESCGSKKDSCRKSKKSNFKDMYPPDMQECTERKGSEKPAMFRPISGSKRKSCRSKKRKSSKSSCKKSSKSKSRSRSKSTKKSKKSKGSCKVKSAGKKGGKCKTFKVDCPPRAREDCKPNFVFKECKGQEAPYPSFSECRPPFRPLPINECTVAARLSRTLKSRINLTPGKGKKKDGGSSKNYSTLRGITNINTRQMLISTEFKRRYSTDIQDFGIKEDLHVVVEGLLKPKNHKDAQDDQLSQCIAEGVHQIHSLDVLPTKQSPNLVEKLWRVFKTTDPPISSLNHDTCESANIAIKLNPRAENTLESNIRLEPRCLGISETAYHAKQADMVEAIQDLCRKVMPSSKSQLPMQEAESYCTENKSEELDALLDKSKQEEF